MFSTRSIWPGWLTNLTLEDKAPLTLGRSRRSAGSVYWFGIRRRVEPKGPQGVPPTAVLLVQPTPTDFEVAQAAIPMGIDPATHLRADDPIPILVQWSVAIARMRNSRSNASGVSSSLVWT